MRDAFGRLQSVLLLGGTSDLGVAVVERMARDGCRTVVLAGRRPEAMEPVAERLRRAGAERVEVLAWDATDIASHGDVVAKAFDLVAPDDLDGVVMAAGVLGWQKDMDADPASAAPLITANYTGAVTTLLHATSRLQEQGHGAVVVLSSITGERVRKANYVYGSSKAALDAFAQGLGDALAGSGVRVLIVRSGWARTQMTEGLEPAPFPTTPEKVAGAVADGLARGRDIVWEPAILRYVYSALRHLPRPLWRKVSAKDT
jgi:decaprenylphospho-beta-D-erythro-pentofuranosid-2-ulose 2-reductase